MYLYGYIRSGRTATNTIRPASSLCYTRPVNEMALLVGAAVGAASVASLIVADIIDPVRPGRSVWAIVRNAFLQLVVIATCLLVVGGAHGGMAILATGFGLARNLCLWFSGTTRPRVWANAVYLALICGCTHLYLSDPGAGLLAAGPGARGVIILAAFLVAIWPGGHWVGHWTSRWASSIPEDDRKMGLPGAGLLIGRIERCLVVLFVLLQRYEAVGFLLAAKSVFRIGDLTNQDERRFAEYIFVGTLLSFATGIAVGIATLLALGIVPNAK